MRWSALILGLVLLAGGLVPLGANLVTAQSGASPASAGDVEARRARLQAELEEEEKAIAVQVELLKAKQRETATVQGEVDLLKSQIERAQASIRAKRVEIQGLETEILAQQNKITELEARIEREQESLAELLRKTHEVGESSLVEIVLTGEGLSQFFQDVDSFELVQNALHRSFEVVRAGQVQAAVEKGVLEERKDAELNAQKEIEAERARIAAKEAERQVVLNVNKSQEQAYKDLLAIRQKRAAEIRSALFALRDTAAIPFGEALKYANTASAATGVRPALILAILEQESNLGENVGSCVITNLQTGETRSLNSGRVFKNGIHPSRDLPLLQTILRELGREPLVTNVSCPLAIGYGGAMGPAQFIPSTWNLMKASIAKAVGKPVPDPWDPRDAFVASAMLLRDNGATGGTYTNERTAACRYYSGRTCYNEAGAPNVGLSYGNQVMARAQHIQVNMIEPLQNV